MKATVDEILYWYDCPRILRATSEDGQPVFAIQVDELENTNRWMAVILQESTMKEVLENKIELRHALGRGKQFCGDFYGRVGEVLTFEEIEPPEDWFPSEGCFLNMRYEPHRCG